MFVHIFTLLLMIMDPQACYEYGYQVEVPFVFKIFAPHPQQKWTDIARKECRNLIPSTLMFP